MSPLLLPPRLGGTFTEKHKIFIVIIIVIIICIIVTPWLFNEQKWIKRYLLGTPSDVFLHLYAHIWFLPRLSLY